MVFFLWVAFFVADATVADEVVVVCVELAVFEELLPQPATTTAAAIVISKARFIGTDSCRSLENSVSGYKTFPAFLRTPENSMQLV